MQLTDNKELSRYELRDDDNLVGFAEYHFHGDEMAFLHTEIRAEYEGRGLGSELIRGALADARSRNLRVLPYCPFVRAWLTKHPDQQDVVPQTHRDMFDM